VLEKRGNFNLNNAHAEIAIGPKTGYIKLYCYKDITLVPRSIFARKAMIVPAMSLSDLISALKRRGFNRVLVKMDCEGCEHEALHEVA